MRRYLFEKAKYFLDTGKVKIISETDHSIRLQVGKFEVVFKYRNHDLISLCTCKANIFNKICSHSIAAQTFLENDKGEIFKK